VGVKFLSEEWATAVTGALNSNDAFKQQAQGKTVKIQQVVSTPEETKYSFKVEDGQAEVALGELSDAEATLTQDYDTAVALARSEVNPVSAFMSGKLKISGDMGLAMKMQTLFKRP